MEKEAKELESLFDIIYPEDSTSEKAAEELANSMDEAIGIAKMENKDGEHVWAVLVSRRHDSKM